MSPQQLVLVQLVLTFTVDTLSAQLNQALESSLRDNMKTYFHKKYFHMAGNSKLHEASNLREWIVGNVSKQKVTRDIHHASETDEKGMDLGYQMQLRNVLHHPSEEIQQEISMQFSQLTNPQTEAAKELGAVLSPSLQRDISRQEDIARLLINMTESLTTAGHQNITKDDITEILGWFDQVLSLRKTLNNDLDSYPKSLLNVLNLFPDRCDETESSLVIALPLLGSFPGFMNLFWPFRFDINVMNQRLALYGLTKKLITNSNETLKNDFFKELQDLQSLPVMGNKILFSFEDDDVIDGLNRSKLLAVSNSYVEAGKHLFTKEERQKISSTASKALDMIKQIHPELYSSMVQLVSCIAFYKDEEAHYMGAASLGAIWLDPSRSKEWTVPFMAEQIVHEFIHTSLQYAELVLGGYKNNTRLPEVKVISAIRKVPRDFDKSLHAAYVSAGLITFHTRAGFFDRAAELAQTLPGAVQELNRVNAETDVLDEAGRAMLHFLTDYVCLTRM